ncbi:hypothetical protein SDC9_195584 [bioreactor metagenome]|uniref:Uncharacterized protein n=1 Tax=bioreactor metagenome TaxID=1076179 RepID=A0A645IA44_9ZZZZ
MANLREIPLIKNKIAMALINNPVIVNLIKNHGDNEIPADELIFKNILPFLYTPDSSTDETTFICIECFPLQPKDSILDELQIDIILFSHKNTMEYNGASRIDLLRPEIDETINGNKNLGVGEAKLQKNTVYVSENKDYHGFTMSYTVSVISRKMCGVEN